MHQGQAIGQIGRSWRCLARALSVTLPAALVAAPATSCLAQVAGESYGVWVARFHESAAAQRAAGRSWSIEVLPRTSAELRPEFPVRPVFERSADGKELTARVPIGTGATLYGLGATPGPIVRTGSLDASAVSAAWVYAVRADGSVVGIVPDTSAPVRLELGETVTMRLAEPGAGGLPVIVMTAESPVRLVATLNELVGRMEMPPRWALGLHWLGARDAAGIERSLEWLAGAGVKPASVSLEAGHGLTWNESAFGPRAVLAERLETVGARMILRLPTSGLHEPSSALAEDARASEHWINGWPGTPDFTRGQTRHWWAGTVMRLAERSTPASIGGFEVVGIDRSAAPEAFHLRPDLDVAPAGARWSKLATLDLMALRATRRSWTSEVGNTPRPFVVSRISSVTSARSSGLIIDPGVPAVPALLSAAVSGQPLAGAVVDVAGGAGALERAGLGSVSPLLLASGTEGPQSADVARVLAGAASLRQQMLPYLYTQLFFAFYACDPIIRPLFFLDPVDPALRTIEDAFLLGPDVLVVPWQDGRDADTRASALLAMPVLKGWKPLPVDRASDAVHLPRLFVRPGAVVALAQRQEPDAKPADAIILVANLATGRDGGTSEARGRLYDDDGDGYAFFNNGLRIATHRVNRQGDQAFMRLASLDGGLGMPTRRIRMHVITDEGEYRAEGSERGTIRIELKK